MKTVSFGFALGAAMLATVGAAQAQQVVKAGFTYNAPPTQYNEEKTFLPTGAMVEVINAIAKDAGFRVEWHPFATGDILPAHNAKIIELSAGQSNPDRLAALDLADAIYSTSEGLYIKKSDPKEYKGIADLKGEVVTVPTGGAFSNTIIKAGEGVFKEVKELTSSATYQAVISGEAKAGFVNALVLAELMRQNIYPDLKMATSYKAAFTFSSGIGVSKGQPDLLKKINTSQAKLKADGTIGKIFAKYGIEFALLK